MPKLQLVIGVSWSRSSVTMSDYSNHPVYHQTWQMMTSLFNNATRWLAQQCKSTDAITFQLGIIITASSSRVVFINPSLVFLCLISILTKNRPIIKKCCHINPRSYAKWCLCTAFSNRHFWLDWKNKSDRHCGYLITRTWDCCHALQWVSAQ